MFHPTDVHIGKRVRALRVVYGLSQAQLADQLGLSFQQVQKYESGANRISGSRLWDICGVLDRPVPYFFEGLDGAVSEDKEAVKLSRQNLELARAVSTLKDGKLKVCLICLVKAIAKERLT